MKFVIVFIIFIFSCIYTRAQNGGRVRDYGIKIGTYNTGKYNDLILRTTPYLKEYT